MGLLLVIGWIIFIVWHNNWLITNRDVSALRIGRILAAAMDIFLWAAIFSAEWDELFSLRSVIENFGSYLILLLLIVLAILILLMIIALNYKDCCSLFHAVLMTLFQFTGGFIIFMLWYWHDTDRNGKSGKSRKT